MHRHLNLLAGTIAIAIAGAAPAATITWAPSATAVAYDQPSQVSTAGLFVDSFSFNGTTSRTVNGVTFNRYAGAAVGSSNPTDSDGFVAGFANGSNITFNFGDVNELYLPYSNGGVQSGIPAGDYGDLLRGNSAAYANLTAASGAYIELTNLSVGAPYQIQIWQSPWDNNNGVHYSSSADFTTGKSPRSESFVNGPGTTQFVIGAFTADATTQRIYFQRTNNGTTNIAGTVNIAAGQLRVVPEPASLSVLVIGSLALLHRQRARA